jgi:hypothetical protein
MILILIISCGDVNQNKKKLNNMFDAKPQATIQKYAKKLNSDLEVLNGWLGYECEQKTVIDSLGIPDYKGEDNYWGVTGSYVQKWEYKSIGLILYMESIEYEGNKKVFEIELTAPSTFVTSKGIGIGSTLDMVLEKYVNEINKKPSDINEKYLDTIIKIGEYFRTGTYFYINEMKVNKIIIIPYGD